MLSLKKGFPLVVQGPVRNHAVDILITAGLDEHGPAEFGIIGQKAGEVGAVHNVPAHVRHHLLGVAEAVADVQRTA